MGAGVLVGGTGVLVGGTVVAVGVDALAVVPGVCIDVEATTHRNP